LAAANVLLLILLCNKQLYTNKNQTQLYAKNRTCHALRQGTLSCASCSALNRRRHHKHTLLARQQQHSRSCCWPLLLPRLEASELTDAAADHAAAAVAAVVERCCRTQPLSCEAGHFFLSVLQRPECLHKNSMLARRQQHIPLLLLPLLLPLIFNAADRAAAVAVV
jgi:hypothetical protein